MFFAWLHSLFIYLVNDFRVDYFQYLIVHEVYNEALQVSSNHNSILIDNILEVPFPLLKVPVFW